MKLFATLTLLFVIQKQVLSQRQSQETCSALNTIVNGRDVENTGETCTLHRNCDSFTCIGVVDRSSDPPVVATSTYTFLPCEDPIELVVHATVSSFPGTVLDHTINESISIDFNPSFLGTIHITLEPTDNGVRFGARIDEPALPPNALLFPETDIPLECVRFVTTEPAAAGALPAQQVQTALVILLAVLSSMKLVM